jgi:uncharacterized membrane protein
MSHHDEQDAALVARVAALERKVAALEASARSTGTLPLPTGSRPRPDSDAAVPVARRTAGSDPSSAGALGPWLSRERWMELGEGLLGRAGIALIVLGLLFLFRFAVDQGWITPVLRIGAGMAVGAGLLGAGLFRFAGRPRYRQILMGGGVIVLFVTGLAASELYALVPGPVSLAFQAAVAALALTIALRQDAASMATIGTVGALLPPTFLLADTVSGIVLWVYLLIVVGWAATLFALRGWRSLLISGSVAACAATFHQVESAPVHVAAVLVLAAVWAAFAALPLLRAALLKPASRTEHATTDAHALSLFPVPLLVTAALAVSATVNLPGDDSFQRVAALAAAGFAAVALLVARYGTRPADGDHGATPAGGLAGEPGVPFAAAVFAALVCGAAALVIWADGSWRVVAMATSAAATIVVARTVRVEAALPVAHLLNATLGIMLLGSIDTLARTPFDPRALAFTAAAALAAGSALLLPHARERLAYLAGVFVAGHVLLATELGSVPDAPWLGSLGYAVAGSTLLVAGLRTGGLLLQRAGMASLALLVVRLFAVDLANVGVGVRIVLFIGCGFTFLALSYMFRMRQPTP